MKAALRDRAPGLVAVLAFIVGWEAYCRLSGVSALLLPAPSAVAVALVELIGERATWRHFAITLGETLAGFTLAAVFGLGLGAAVARSRLLERAVQPFVVASQVVPKVALVPLFVLWFGFGPTSKIVVSAVIAFFPVLTNTLLGMRSVEAGHRDVFRAARAGSLQRFWLLELPAALPAVLAGMEMAIVLATIGAVVGEFLGGSAGLGYLAVATMNAFQTDRLFGIILMLALMGLVLHAAIGALRRVMIPWHEAAIY